VDYDRWAGDDHGEGEGTGSLQGRAFPHPLGFAPLTLQTYYGALYNSPYGNELLLELALRALEAEKLGHDDEPDLLCLSFSSNDAVGHTWGPDSHEVLDTTLRTDRIVARLLQTLDRLVGENQYVVALTADHGICPLPEVARPLGINAGRVTLGRADAELERHLTAKFGAPSEKQRWIESRSGPWYYLNLQLMERLGLSSAEVELVVADFFAQQPGIEAAYTREQLARQDLDPHGIAVRNSTHPERAGEVYVLHKPYHLVMGPVGTSHGSPYAYDTHVPLLLYGCGVRTAVRDERITPLAAAGLLARSLGISPPPEAEELNLSDIFVEANR
jgi:predicted AlkP superfamily pyrophosphatase or phosphodiesterase